jgi:hypothetical protein
MDGVTPQYEGHKECAVFMGNSKEEVDYLCRWLEDKPQTYSPDTASEHFPYLVRFKMP